MLIFLAGVLAQPIPFDLKIEQITSGTKHHFFGYIGQCRTIPWNAPGRYIMGLEIDTIDRMPDPDEAATIILIDTREHNRIIRVDKTHAGNPQQGTMFYWNPLAPETQFFSMTGIFIVDIKTGEKRLLVSYRQLEVKLKEPKPDMEHSGLFINHTLWNRDADRVYFFVRSGWDGHSGDKNNVLCPIYFDGTGLTLLRTHIGGHPEWAEKNLLIGREDGGNDSDDRQIFYNVDTKEIIGKLGNPEMFPKPEGDISLSPDGNWFVNGYGRSSKNYYAVYNRRNGAFMRSEGIDKGTYSGDIRIDPAPRWNRTDYAILVPGIAGNGTRQMFVIRIITP